MAARKANSDEACDILINCQKDTDFILKNISGDISVTGAKKYEKIVKRFKEISTDAIILKKNDKKISKRLEGLKVLTELFQKQLLNEKEIFYEIVFMPYNASMWDSMESIWRAASSDPCCRVSVIPIPYYERKSDGNAEILHYDGDSFPDYIPITDYKLYDLAAIQPEAIFIHNPDDCADTVFKVNSKFHSNELKNYTNMLVFVPPFTTADNPKEDFLNLPSIVNFNMIIAPSEKIAASYRKFVPDNRIAALGSPKFDAVLYAQKFPLRIPTEWENIINGRKIVLYSTATDLLLLQHEDYLLKLKYVFKCFENQSDIVLLWRPHPFTKAVIRSKLPQIYQEYLDLEKYFEEKKVGIFDDSPDLHRAIAVSDIYYGDNSSSSYLFGLTGKPVIIQDISLIHSAGEMKNLTCRCASVNENGNIWFLDRYINGLFYYDTETKKVKLISKIPGENSFGRDTYSVICANNSFLISPPNKGHAIVMYDPLTNLMKKVGINRSKTNLPTGMPAGFQNAINNENGLFFLSEYYLEMAAYEMQAQKVSYLPKPVEKNLEYMPSLGYSEGNWILMPIKDTNHVIKHDPLTKEGRICRIGEKADRHGHITYDGKYFWIFPLSTGPVFKWSLDTRDEWKYDDYPENFKTGDFSFANLVNCGDYILAFPHHANMVLKVDINSGEITKFDLLPALRYLFAFIKDEIIYAFTEYKRTLHLYNVRTSDYEMIHFSADDTLIHEICKDSLALLAEKKEKGVNDFLIPEQACLGGAPSFISNLLSNNDSHVKHQSEIFAKLAKYSDGTSGTEILKHIMRKVPYPIR